jgi:hypothetical protein
MRASRLLRNAGFLAFCGALVLGSANLFADFNASCGGGNCHIKLPGSCGPNGAIILCTGSVCTGNSPSDIICADYFCQHICNPARSVIDPDGYGACTASEEEESGSQFKVICNGPPEQ